MTDSNEDDDDDKELAEMWGTVTEITSLGSALVKFDEGGETLIQRLWTKWMSNFDHDTLMVGTRVRCIVSITCKPEYAVEAILNAVHDGGKRDNK
jgi:hypothetical protein